MKYTLSFIVLFIGAINVSHAFTVGGISSDMTMQVVKAKLAQSNYKLEISENKIHVTTYPDSPTLTYYFCNDKVVKIQKFLKPHFDGFVREVEKYRNVLGKQTDAWSESTNFDSETENNSFTFLWKADKRIVTVIYVEKTIKKLLITTHENKNTCWGSPY